MRNQRQTRTGLSAVHREYLKALSDGRRTGKQLRGRLRRNGVRGRNGAFYRLMQRLKAKGLVTSIPVRDINVDYRGPECFYELTDLGWQALEPKLELVDGEANQGDDCEANATSEQVRACLG